MAWRLSILAAIAAMLVACGGSRLTATPTTAPKPPGVTVSDSSGRCQATIGPSFKAVADRKDSYQTTDELAILLLAGTPSNGATLNEMSDKFLKAMWEGVEGYQETARTTGKQGNAETMMIGFTGKFSGKPATAQVYLVQDTQQLCTITVLVTPPGDTKYGTEGQTVGKSLTIVQH